ncbi:hypothetical protein ABFS82_02G134200 [Erythranthe guttata]
MPKLHHADTEAFKLNGSESEREVAEILKRRENASENFPTLRSRLAICSHSARKKSRGCCQLEPELLQAKRKAEPLALALALALARSKGGKHLMNEGSFLIE